MDIALYQQHTNDLSEALTRLGERIQGKGELNESYKKIVNDGIIEIQKRLGDLKERYSSIQKRISSGQEERVSEVGRLMDEMKNKNEELQKELDNTTKKGDDASDELQRATEGASMLQADLEGQGISKNELQNRIVELQKYIESAQNEINEMRNSLTSLKAEMINMTAIIELLDSAIVKSIQEINSMIGEQDIIVQSDLDKVNNGLSNIYGLINEFDNNMGGPPRASVQPAVAAQATQPTGFFRNFPKFFNPFTSTNKVSPNQVYKAPPVITTQPTDEISETISPNDISLIEQSNSPNIRTIPRSYNVLPPNPSNNFTFPKSLGNESSNIPPPPPNMDKKEEIFSPLFPHAKGGKITRKKRRILRKGKKTQRGGYRYTTTRNSNVRRTSSKTRRLRKSKQRSTRKI